MMVVGPSELAPELAGPERMITVPPLSAPQVAPYVDHWLRATRAPEAPPLILTIDAALLIGHRAEGNLARINSLVRQMITSGGSVLTSWDAYAASDRGSALGAPRIRPAVWPTPEVVRVINQCRAAAGLAERDSLA
jgi:hypothetical protein